MATFNSASHAWSPRHPQLRHSLSHGSATVLHGLPVKPEAVEKVHVIRSRHGHGTKRSVVQVHGAPLGRREVTWIDGVPATSLTRTVLDLARTLPMEQAVASGDRAFALGLPRETIGEFDGKIKYGRLLKPGQRIEDVIFDKKLREDALRDFGWQIVRWLWRDLHRRGVLRDRVQRAFGRAS